MSVAIQFDPIRLPAEAEALRVEVRTFLKEELAAGTFEPHASRRPNPEFSRKVGEKGWIGLTWPKEYGGQERSFLERYVINEEFLFARAPTRKHFTADRQSGPVLLKYASEDLKQKWLPKMVTGEIIGAIAMTDPSGGSDLANLKTKAVRDGDDYVISGQKVFITNGQTADIVIVACRTSDERAKGVSLILVEADRAGFKKGRNLEKIGWKAQDTSELFFDEVRVPVSNIVGIEGNGFVQLMEQLPQERLLQGIRCASVIEAGLEWTVDYVRDRQAFGKTVASFQNTRFKLAEVHSKSTMMRVFVDRCIAMHLEGKLDANDAAMCKMLSSELMMELLDECLQLFGGYGYMWEYPIARAWADGRQSRLAGGTGEIMREIIGRELVGRG